MTNGERAYALRVVAAWFERDWEPREKQPDTDTVKWAIAVVKTIAKKDLDEHVWQ